MEGERRPSKRNSKKENKKHPYKRRFVEDDVIANKKHSSHISRQSAEVANNCEEAELSIVEVDGSDLSLSDKMEVWNRYDVENAKKDVKEAVQKLKYFFTSSGDYSKECIQEEIDKIFGDKLK